MHRATAIVLSLEQADQEGLLLKALPLAALEGFVAGFVIELCIVFNQRENIAAKLRRVAIKIDLHQANIAPKSTVADIRQCFGEMHLFQPIASGKCARADGCNALHAGALSGRIR